MKEKMLLSLMGVLSMTLLVEGTTQAQNAPSPSAQLQAAAEMRARMQQARDFGPMSGQGAVRGTSDPEALARARAHQSRMRPMKMGVKAPKTSDSGMTFNANGINITYSDKQWEQMGPFNMTPPYTASNGPGYVTGRVNGVAYDAQFPNTRYVVAPNGGVWKTTDAGFTWKPLGDTFPNLSCSTVATDPRNGRILYVGMGDFVGTYQPHLPKRYGAAYTANLNAFGIMKSTNGGNTFVNIGRAEMGGAGVSAIVVDPTDSRLVMAASGRGLTAGCLWRSVNGGTTWAKAKLSDGSDMPVGDWTSIKIFNPYNLPQYRVATIPQYYFATRTGNDAAAGLYRSDDRGTTWRKVSVPLRYNGQSVIPNNGQGVLEVTPSVIDPKTIYVMDSNSDFADGKLFRGKLLDGPNGTKYSWVEVTGSFPTNDGPLNNWAYGSLGSILMAVPARVQSVPGDSFSLVDSELVYGGLSTLSAALPLFDVRNWSDVSFSSTQFAEIGAEQNSMAYNPQASSEQMITNHAGAFTIVYDPDNGGFNYISNNTNLVVTRFVNADFNRFNSNAMLGGSEDVGAIQYDLNNLIWKGIGTPAFAEGNNYRGISASSFLPFFMGGVAIHPTRSNVQYATTAGYSAWTYLYSGYGSGHIYQTTNNWQTAIDITPDRYNEVINNGAVETRYFFPFQNDTDSSVATAWKAQIPAGGAPQVALKVAMVSSGTSTMYTGVTQLWRYTEAPASKPDTSTPPKRGNYGWWRPVGTQVVGPITAIAMVNDTRGYVGTLDGRVWMVTNIGVINAQGDLGGNWTELTTGRGRTTLPVAPINDIKVVGSNPGDILVALGGSGIPGHLWRCADTGANNLIFTAQNGDVSSNDPIPSFLPDVSINEIAIDSNDPQNTWLVGTDIGVFGTTNHGTTWNDATAPLGLPNAEVVSMKLSPITGYLSVATYGRGAWKFDLGNAQEVRTPANLSISYTLSRSGSEIFAVVRVANDPTAGPAESVTLTNSSLLVRTTNTATTTGMPVSLGTLGPGRSKTTTLRFPALVGPSGTAATFNLGYTYAGNPVVNYASRTRLP
jgi:hypothetical protein